MTADFELLAPFPDHAAPRIWTWTEEFRHQVMDDYGPQTLAEFMADWQAKAPLRLSWGILRAGELGGVVIVDRVSPILGVASFLCKRPFWGQPWTVAALRDAYSRAFASGLQKLSTVVFSDNANVIHLARQIGAVREGKLRQHTLRKGKPVDMLILGVLPADLVRAAPKVEVAA